MHLVSFHFPFMCVIFHVLPLSGHILSLSLHAMSKISQIEFSECMTVVTMVVTIYMCEYWKNQVHTHTKTCPFVFVPFPFHFCSHSFHAFLFSCQFSFTSFHVPSISVNHIFAFRSSYFISLPFLLFSRLSDVPLISLSVRLMFLLIFLSCPFHFTLLSLQFRFLFPSSLSISLVCPVVF